MDPTDLIYDLPPELIAQRPTPRRTDARLLVVRREEGALEHRTIGELPTVLAAGDLLVFNDSKVFRARVIGHRPSGGRLELLFVRALSDDGRCWDVIVRGTPRVGEDVILPDASGRWEACRGGGRWTIEVESKGGVADWLNRVGMVPLPPYIRRPDGPEPEDAERYQTVLAQHPGAVAAPTAGLHFTRALLGELAGRGVPHSALTLHVGPGTFLSLRPTAGGIPMVEPEWYRIPVETVRAIEAARQRKGRVIAVGTTSCRALESAGQGGRALESGAGWADAVIRPGHEWRVVDALLTNFHLPGTPLLALVAALTGWPLLGAAYEEAVKERYRFYSYGDAMVIL